MAAPGGVPEFKDDEWDVEQTAEFITSRGFSRVALQLPDDLLAYTTQLAEALQRRLGDGHQVRSRARFVWCMVHGRPSSPTVRHGACCGP